MSESYQVDAAARPATRQGGAPTPPAIEQRRIKFSPQELQRYADRILGENGPRAIRVREISGEVSVVFVARHEDVTRVLSDEKTFTLDHYQKLLSTMAPAGARLVLENDNPARDARYAIMRRASEVSPFFDPKHSALRDVARECVRDLIDNFMARPKPEFDMIGEYGFLAPHRISKRVFGVGVSSDFDFLAWLVVWLKYNPLPLPFSPVTGSYLRQCTWAQLTFAQLFANFENRNRLLAQIAKWAYPKLSDLIRRDMRENSDRVDGDTPSLLSALLQVQPEFAPPSGEEVEGLHDKDAYAEHVLFIMLEIVGTAFVLPGMAFANVITQLAAEPALLSQRLSLLTESNGEQWMDEALRVAPPAAFVLRKTSAATAIGDFAIEKGEYVAAMMGRAASDLQQNPGDFRLDRDPDLYLTFSAMGGPHRCFGRTIALTMLAEMFRGLQRLPNLQAAGELKRFVSIPVHMPFRFSQPKGASHGR